MDLLSILDGTPEPPIVDLHLEKENNSGDYHLPTPMYEFQKELTDQIVSLHYSDILKYCETDDTAELIVKSLEICIDNCMLVATHPYLLIEHYMPKNLCLRDIPAKLAETSGKFSVLRDLVNVIVRNTTLNSPKHVGLVMKNDQRCFDLYEALLLGSFLKHVVRLVGSSIKKDGNKGGRRGQGSTIFHLIPHDLENVDPSVRFDTFVILDSYVDTSTKAFANLRRQHRATEAVVIRLVPMNSIEHTMLHYGKAQDLYKLISSIVCLRDQLGNLPPDIFPIYNQNLTYLSHTFFDQLFKRDRLYPSWPLPDLPSIPRFSPTDVERSLLTEVVYHYTPYETENEVVPKKKSFYESRRLQSDYVTNPLKNDYSILSGIHTHAIEKPSDSSVLTHKLLLELNASHFELDLAKEEEQSYIDFNGAEREAKVGRRLRDIQAALSSIISDVDHAEQRIHVADRKTEKRKLEVETMKASIAENKQRLENADNEYAANQFKIWNLQNEVKELAKRLHLKSDEHDYMAKEVENCKASIEQSNGQLAGMEEKIKDAQAKVKEAEEEHAEDTSRFKKQRVSMEDEFKQASDENRELKAKLTKTLKFLAETAHLRKKKGKRTHYK